MCVKSILATDIAEAYSIKLSCVSSASSINWEKNWPSEAAASEADGNDDLKEAQKKIAIERVVS
jgi:hypothetical protein